MNILILARMTTSFDGETYKTKPMGGSESALFYISRELAKLGHHVVIFNNCGTRAGIYEQVEYQQFTTLLDLVKYSQQNHFDIFITFRDLSALLFPIRATKRICWLQDDFSNVWNIKPPLKWLGLAFLKFAGLLTRHLVDELFVVSSWLGDICHNYLGIPTSKIYITSNGVNLVYFDNWQTKKTRNRLVYSSVPNRGLDVLLKVLPLIRKELPQTELHIYGGLNLGVINEEQESNMKKILDLTHQPGVVLEGAVPHQKLAQDLCQSGLWVYPSHSVPEVGFYAETSCVAVLEAQAAGCPVVASKRGALIESVLDRETGVLIEGDPFSLAYQESFATAVVDLLNNEEKYSKMQLAARKFIEEKYSWQQIALKWQEEFTRLINPLT